MHNPYVTALADAAEHVRDLVPAHDIVAIPERISAFFDAMDINHPGNKAKVCTAIAHTMSNQDIQETIDRLKADMQEYFLKLQELEAPQYLLDNAFSKYSNELGILLRVLGKRQVKKLVMV